MDSSRRHLLGNLSAAAALALLGPRVYAAPAARVTTIRHIRPEGSYDLRNAYYLELLTLALTHTVRSDGAFRLEPAPAVLAQGRAIAELEAGHLVDVLWTMTTRERETALWPVRIPLLKGLMGNRLFIIRRGEAERFASVRRPEDLKKFVAVQGYDWPDADILEANGLPVVRSEGYESLFHMLALGRVDYFPRALNEPWDELLAPNRTGLALEPRLLLRYTTDNYFFVNRDNPALGERIERGLRAAIADGSFERLFRGHPANAYALGHARVAQRRVLRLRNPLLSPETPVGDRSLWLYPPP